MRVSREQLYAYQCHEGIVLVRSGCALILRCHPGSHAHARVVRHAVVDCLVLLVGVEMSWSCGGAVGCVCLRIGGCEGKSGPTKPE
jgi:hypothetical protein